MVAILVSVIWAVVALVAIWRIDLLVRRFLSFRDPKSTEPDEIVLPDDLIALALGESETYAQESMLEVIRERFNSLHDWNKVRHAMGVGEIDP